MNQSKSIVNIPKKKNSKSLQNINIIRELSKKLKKDIDQNLNHTEIDVPEIKLNN